MYIQIKSKHLFTFECCNEGFDYRQRILFVIIVTNLWKTLNLSKVSDEYDLNTYINAFHNIISWVDLRIQKYQDFYNDHVRGNSCALVHHEKDLTVRCLSSSNMSKEIAHVFRVKDLVFAVVKIDNEDFSVPNECWFGLSGFNELPSLVG